MGLKPIPTVKQKELDIKPAPAKNLMLNTKY